MFYIVFTIQGSRITARRATDGRIVCRDASQFKLVNAVINTADEPETGDITNSPPASPELDRSGMGALPNLPTEKPVQEETTSMENADTLSELPQQEPTQHEMESDQATTSKTPVMDQPPTTRHRRDRRRPAYLQDYELA